MAIVMSSFLACFSYVQLNHLISLVSFCDPHTLFLFFFFCSQKYNKKLWNWVLINLGPVSNCPFSACLYGFVHVCQFVCPCLRLWTCHASFPHLYIHIFFLTTLMLAFSVVFAFRPAQTATGWELPVSFCLFSWFKVKICPRSTVDLLSNFQVGSQLSWVFGKLLRCRFLQWKGKKLMKILNLMLAFLEELLTVCL